MPITTGHFGKALWPGINAWWGKAYNEYPEEWSKIFDKATSRRAFEEDVQVSSFGLAPVKREGAPVAYDTEEQGFVTRYTHLVYALGFIITREMVEDDLYDIVGERRAKALAFSMRQTKETVAANVLNRAFNSSFVYGDGQPLLSASHPNVAGGTFSNRLAVDSDLSEAALEQACIDIAKFTDDRGLKIAAMPEKLIIPVDLMFEVDRILKSEYRPGTNNNDINALNLQGRFKDVVVNHYLTDTDAWFIKTNVPNGLKCFQRRPVDFSMDNDFDSDNAKYKATERYSFGCTDPRGVFGSPGA
ncbi:MAG: hypothetical protein D6698_02315 [Gammaproteobacteria bacterium]|nr:MAG: hypothetical protein D6698_02315 [Gammaproteobacteria bacterium]